MVVMMMVMMVMMMVIAVVGMVADAEHCLRGPCAAASEVVCGLLDAGRDHSKPRSREVWAG